MTLTAASSERLCTDSCPVVLMETRCGLFCYSACREVLQQDVEGEASDPVRLYGRLAELGNYSQAAQFTKIAEARVAARTHYSIDDCTEARSFSDIVALGPRCLRTKAFRLKWDVIASTLGVLSRQALYGLVELGRMTPERWVSKAPLPVLSVLTGVVASLLASYGVDSAAKGGTYFGLQFLAIAMVVGYFGIDAAAVFDYSSYLKALSLIQFAYGLNAYRNKYPSPGELVFAMAQVSMAGMIAASPTVMLLTLLSLLSSVVMCAGTLVHTNSRLR